MARRDREPMMFGRKKEPVCAIVGSPCPRTSDPQAERFCPYWSPHPILEEDKVTGATRAVEHCTARVAVRAMIEAMGASRSAAAATESMRNTVVRLASARGQQLVQTPPPTIEGRS